MGQWIDAHCHLTDLRLENSWREVLTRARAVGIDRFLLGGVDPDEWTRQISLATQDRGIYPCAGLHPWWVDTHSDTECDDALQKLETFLMEHSSIGIGELGLDFGPRTQPESRTRQLRVFRKQLEIASRLGKPLVLHVVKAHEEVLKELEAKPPGKGLVHAFFGGPTVAQRYLNQGLCLSLGGAVLRIGENGGKGFDSLKRTVISVPLSALVLESDCPDGVEEPSKLLEVAERIGSLRGISANSVLDQSRETLLRIFDL